MMSPHRFVWGERIRAARRAKGWRQAELSQAMGGIDPSMISRWERGRAVPRDDNRILLSKTLGIPTAELFAYPEDDTHGGEAAA